MGKHILDEAKRCLDCKKPRCVEGCPVRTDIPGMIRLLLQGQIRESGEQLFANNPLSVVCALVCPHEKQCEGHCILSLKGNPVHISTIEHYISDYNLDTLNLAAPRSKVGHVAIIGSGPAGITLAFVLALRGYQITLFEMNDKIGGVLRYGIPEFRLPKDIIDRLKKKLIELGVVVRPNTLIGPVITLEDLFRDGYDALFIGTGVWNPKKLGIKGETLGHVHFAIDYLRSPEAYDLGKRVVVIGAGNVAMDVARTALRRGAQEVTILYRKGEADLPAGKYEVDYAKLDGVSFEFYKSPLELVPEGVLYCETEATEDGHLIEHRENPALFPCDSIMIAVSQGPKSNIVDHTEGITLNAYGLVVTDEMGRTTRDGVFASGDVVTGARTVVEAVKYTKQVADIIDNYVQSKQRE